MKSKLATIFGCVLLASRLPLAWSLDISTERLSGSGVWVDPVIEKLGDDRLVDATVWFDEQLLGDGKAYLRRAQQWKGAKRRELRAAAVAALKRAHQRSMEKAQPQIAKLEQEKTIRDLCDFWIVNGFRCTTRAKNVAAIRDIPGVRKIFIRPRGVMPRGGGESASVEAVKQPPFDPSAFQHPWYIRYLMADKVWDEFQVTGEGALNIVHDNNFLYFPNVNANLYHRKGEVPGNEKDDDGNGLVDDAHGFNFDNDTGSLQRVSPRGNLRDPRVLHGTLCAAVICGVGTEGSPFEFGIAPRAKWAGVIANWNVELGVQWAIEQRADTYSMSFSIPGLGQYRSHWRKMMEHGSMCGVYFVSGAGNFAQTARIPVQMRVPEDIPHVVFAAAGVQRNLQRTPFSSKGPVEWATEHYQDGRVAKPEVCAFNMGLPLMLPNGKVAESGLDGNSFAGPMFCGAIALMLSADPDLLPWDLREIITETATDVAAPGVDSETGHGLINCYRAVKEVLRRKAIREGADPSPYTGRVDNDALDVPQHTARIGKAKLFVQRVQPKSAAAKLGIQPGDCILAFNGQNIDQLADLRRFRVAAKDQGDEHTLKIRRDEKEMELKIPNGMLGIAIQLRFAEPVFQ